jgi:hypothetical protein
LVSDTINIVGRGNGMELAPDENCWGINMIIFERDVDVHFDMHQEGLMKPHQTERREKVIEVAKEKNTPVYSCEAIEGTTYIRYPIEDVISEFPTGYFSNGVCYMIALALLNGVKELNFYGVNHSRISMMGEYTLQKPGVDFWLGVALGRGVKCNIHGAMAEIGRTFENRSYGYFLSQETMVKKYGKLIGAVVTAVQ